MHMTTRVFVSLVNRPTTLALVGKIKSSYKCQDAHQAGARLGSEA